MRSIIISAVLTLFSSACFSQILFHSKVMSQYYWSKSTEKWVFVESNEEDNSVFLFSEDLKSVTHSEGRNRTRYDIESIKSDDDKSFKFEIYASNGKEYLLILSLDKDKPYVIIIFEVDGQAVMLSYTEV